MAIQQRKLALSKAIIDVKIKFIPDWEKKIEIPGKLKKQSSNSISDFEYVYSYLIASTGLPVAALKM